MELLKAQVARLQQQYAALNASQKMLVGSLVIIMVMTLIWFGSYAGQAEMEVVLDHDFAADDMSRITAQLASKGIPYKTSGSRIMVPADRKLEVIADITYAQLLPQDTVNAFDEIVGKMSSPWDTGEKTGALHNRAKEVMLAQVIRNFPLVRSAAVMIDPTVKRSLGGNGVLPSATVSINLRPGAKFDKRLVSAAADVVAGAVAAMPKNRVKVIVDGASHSVADDGEDGIAASNAMDLVRDWERHYAGKIAEQLAYIDGVMVHVSVKVNDVVSQKYSKKFDAKNKLTLDKSIKEDKEESNNTSHAGGDAGVIANAGLQLPGAAPAGGDAQTQNREKNELEKENYVPVDEEWSRTRPGGASVTGASVQLPRSFFVKAYKVRMRTDKDPDDKVLETYIGAQLTDIRSAVKACIDVKDDTAVVVNTYTDLLPNAADALPATSAVSSLVGGHAKEIALGALALVSLFMVSMLVRKSGGGVSAEQQPAALAEALAGKAGAKGALGAGAAGEVPEEAHEVGEGIGPLDGIELDEDAVRSQQMLEQVATMVKENPDSAANLVKRWMNRA